MPGLMSIKAKILLGSALFFLKNNKQNSNRRFAKVMMLSESISSKPEKLFF